LRYSQGSPFYLHNIHMARINNQELKKAFSDATKTQVSEQPNDISNRTVIPVIDITPRHHKIINIAKSASITNATSATVYTTPTDQDFYLTSATLSYIKDATSTSTAIALEVIPKDVANAAVLRFAALTLTAANGNLSQSFVPPILLKRGSNINVTSDTNIANIKAMATVQGYTDDVD
jgi:hypothetical protein